MTEPVILLPGLLCDARLWAHQLLHLSQHRPVTVVQPKGASIEEMAAQVLAAAPAKFALVGCGMGGDVAMDVLRRALDRVTRIALISTDPMQEAPSVAAAREARMVAARSGRLWQALGEEYPVADMGPTMRRAMVPALIMGGARDTVVPLRRHEFVAKLMPFGRLKIFDGLGHLLPLEAPEAVTSALEVFLRGPMLLK